MRNSNVCSCDEKVEREVDIFTINVEHSLDRAEPRHVLRLRIS